MFKIHHGQHPKAILVLFNRRFNESTRTTRQQQHFVVPKARCKIYEKSIIVQGPKNFNELVNIFNLNCSIHTYKKLLSHHFLNSLEWNQFMTICDCVLYIRFGLNSTWQTVSSTQYLIYKMLISSYTLLYYHLNFYFIYLLIFKLPFVDQGFHKQYMLPIPKSGMQLEVGKITWTFLDQEKMGYVYTLSTRNLTFTLRVVTKHTLPW